MTAGREGGQALFLTPDLDGDGRPDTVAAIARLTDGAPGLAICPGAGGPVIVAGYAGRIGRHLDPVYFGRADFWRVYPKGPVYQGGSEGPPPELTGDAILLAKEESSSVLVFLDKGGRVTSYWQGD